MRDAKTTVMRNKGKKRQKRKKRRGSAMDDGWMDSDEDWSSSSSWIAGCSWRSVLVILLIVTDTNADDVVDDRWKDG